MGRSHISRIFHKNIPEDFKYKDELNNVLENTGTLVRGNARKKTLMTLVKLNHQLCWTKRRWIKGNRRFWNEKGLGFSLVIVS